MEPIEFKGINKLEELDQRLVQKMAAEYYGKIQREIKNITSVVVHVKPSSKGGHTVRYEITVRAVAPTRIFESSYEDYDLAKCLHKVFKDIEREITHAFHSN